MENIPREKLEGILAQFALTDRVAVVTGGSKGLGRGIALALAAAGAHVAPVSRTPADLELVAGEIRSFNRCALPVVADVTVEAQVQQMVERVVAEFGRIDILVNAAGIVILKPTVEFPVADWEKVIRVNLEGTFLACKEVGKAMIGHGRGLAADGDQGRGQERGKIINLSSVRGLQGRAKDPAYPASKGAVNLLTRSLAIEWAPLGVNVNALAPTFIRTDLNAFLLDDETTRDWVLSRIPMGRVGQIWDLFGAAVFLASPASDFITGHVLYVDGGWTAA